MARQLEDPEYAHDPKDLDHALQVLKREVRLHFQDNILKGLFHQLTRL